MDIKEHFNFTITAVPQLIDADYAVNDRATMLLEKTYFEVSKKKVMRKNYSVI